MPVRHGTVKVRRPAEEPLPPVPITRRPPRPPSPRDGSRGSPSPWYRGPASESRRSTAAARSAPSRRRPNVTFYGRGWGHGVGMSQYGARGRALAGQLAPAILAHYYAGTTLGTRSPRTIVRVLLLTGFTATAANPLTITGLGGSWTIDGDDENVPRERPADARPDGGGATTWALRVSLIDGTPPEAHHRVGRRHHPTGGGRGPPRADLQAVDLQRYRGYLRIRLTTTATVVNHVAGRSLPARRRAARDALELAGRGAERPGDRGALVRAEPRSTRRPARSTCTTTPARRSIAASGARLRRRTRRSTATAGKVLLSGSAVANALFHSSDGGWTENNENVFVSSTGSDRGRTGARTCGGRATGRPTDVVRQGIAVRDVEDGDLLRSAQLSAIFATDARTNVGTINALDLSRRGVSGRLISVTLARQPRHEDRVRRACSVGRSTPAGRRADPQLRGTLFDIGADPLTTGGRARPAYRRAYDSTDFDPTVPRCWWSGAPSERPDPLMVRYHDEEWGTPLP